MVDGTLGFFDVSGYTRLTERLARLGAEGAEAITEIADALFVGLISAAFAQGGDVLQFSGDAVLIHFTGSDHPRRAALAARAMQAFIGREGSISTEIGRVRLRMSVGMHAGPATFARLGEGQQVVLALGEHISRALAAEKEASATEVLVTSETAELLPPEWGRPTPSGMVRLLRVPSEPQTALDATELRPTVADEVARAFVPRPVRDLLAAGAIPGEHRQLSLAFIGARGLDRRLEQDGADATVARLQQLAVEIERAQAEYDLLWVGADALPGAADFVLVAGSPTAHEDDEDRLLTACREILDAGIDLDLAVGVNRGRNFTGDVGHPWRRTYSISGDATNLAARIMAHAEPGQLLVHLPVLDRVRGRVRAEPVAPFHAKGKAAPVETVDLEGIRSTREVAETLTTPMLGRDEALRMVGEGIVSGGTVEVTGPAGVGKTRLVEEAIAALGAPVVRVTAEPFARARPLAAARRLLRRSVGIDDDADPVATDASLRAVVTEHARGLEPWLPLLADVVGAPVAMTPEVEALDAEFIAERRDAVAAELLRAVLAPGTVLFLDAYTGFDEASRDLVEHIATSTGVGIGPALVVAHRGDEVLVDIDRTSVTLGPIDDADARRIAIDLTDDAPLPEPVLDRVVARAGGNPFFVRELALAAQAGDTLAESVERIVAARFDGLPVRPRLALRDAAVIGRRLDLALLAAVTGDHGLTDPATWIGTEEFATVRDGVLEFREAAHREIAYEGLAMSRRRTLHAAYAHLLAASPGADAALLAEHAVLGRDWLLAWEWTQRALEAALARSAPNEAYAAAVDAVTVGSRLDHPDLGRLGALEEQAGDLAYRIGARTEAGRWYGRRQRSLAAGSVDLGRVMRKRGDVAAREGALTQSLRWYTRALGALAAAPASAARESEEVEVVLARATSLHHEGRNRESEEQVLTVLERAEAIGGDRAAQALLHLATLTALTVRPDGEPYATRARTTIEALGDDFRLGCLELNLGAATVDANRPAPALERYAIARAAFERCGDAEAAALAIHNTGECLATLGRDEEAIGCFEEASRRFRACGRTMGVHLASSGLGRAAAWRGDTARALELLGAARDGFASFGQDAWRLDAELRILEAAYLAGREVPEADLDAVLDAVARLDDPGIMPVWGLRLRGALAARRGDSDGAVARLREAADLARHGGHEVEEVAALVALLLLDGDQSLRERRDALVAAVGIERSLAL
ncbi:MAG: AAA family ATPase [Actinomycetes bacterium]